MDRSQLTELAQRYLSGTATEKEVESLHEWYDAAGGEGIELVFTEQPELEEDIRLRILTKLQQETNLENPAPQGEYPRDDRFRVGRRGKNIRWAAAAAIIIALFSTGEYFWSLHRPKKEVSRIENTAAKTPDDLPPGGNKAKLLLGDGSVVALEGTPNGVIKEEAGTRINKLDGQLIYDASQAAVNGLLKGKETVFNTIITPRGGQYQVILPDGSKVWLDAASSLSYPTAFTGKERHVELHGEAYFEVAENKNKPFTVDVDDMRVDVLGTHFNVMAYEDEHAIKTTLLEGAVKVTKGDAAHTLKAGEEASLNRETGALTVGDADGDAAVAWKNGFFQFEGASIETVMRQIARWYDVDVAYTGVTGKHFRGMISRSVNVSEVFEMLELTGEVHFKMAGKKIIVMP
jgi:transmembrane sensor